MKVGILALYFGNLPNYFPIWLKSCEYNQTIDFFLITDADIDAFELPKNVKHISISFSELKKQINEKLQMDVVLDRPYKLCDYRPAYGLIFEDILYQYDYWGHCDLDVVWGDLRKFFNLYHFEEYDKFLDRGHLTLYRNTFENNRLFQNETDCVSYKNVFSVDKSCFFDETDIGEIFFSKGKKIFSKCIYADMNLFYSDFRHAAHTDNPRNYRHQLFCWEEGHVFQYYLKNNKIVSQEWLYLHFQKRNMNCPTFEVQTVNRFLITPNGFIYPYGNIDVGLIDQYNNHGSYKDNLFRREYVYCGKDHLKGHELFEYIVVRSKSVICNSILWKKSFRKLWIKYKNKKE